MKDFYKLLFVCIVAYSSFGVVSAYFCTPEQISNNDPSCDGVCGSAHDQPGYDQSNAPGEPLCVLGDSANLARSVTLDYWTWQCVSRRGGSDASCSTLAAPSPANRYERRYDNSSWGSCVCSDIVTSQDPDPRFVKSVGSFDPQMYDAHVVAGSAAYFALKNSTTGQNSIQSFSLADPQNPILSWSFDIVPGEGPIPSDLTTMSITAIQVVGNYMYVGISRFGLVVYDISNPSAITAVGHFSDYGYNDPFNVADIAVIGDRVYLAAAGYDTYPNRTPYDMLVLDTSNMSSIAMVSAYATPGFGKSLSIDGNYAYVHTLYPDALVAIDLTNTSPTTPNHQPSLSVPAIPLYNNVPALGSVSSAFLDSFSHSRNGGPTAVDDFVVRDGYAYVGHYRGFTVLDVSNPSNFQSVYSTGTRMRGVALHGNYLVATDSGTNAYFLDVSNPSAPVTLYDYTYPTVHTLTVPYIDANVFYMMSDRGGMDVFMY